MKRRILLLAAWLLLAALLVGCADGSGAEEKLTVVTTSFPENLLPLVATLNYLLFCGDILFSAVSPARFRQRQKTVSFRREAGRIRREQQNLPYRFKCAVCGRTEVSNPELEFRYCSRCAGYHCFCQDHINNHIHFTE